MTSLKGRAMICAGWLSSLIPHRQGLRILTYHGVSRDRCGEWEIDTGTLENHLRYLQGAGFRGVRVSQIVEEQAQVLSQPETIAITFDDGLASHFDLAADLLARYGMTATFFIPTGFIRSERYHEARFNDSMMSWADIRSLQAQGFEIGSHARTHEVLARAAPGTARDEIVISKQELEDQLGSQVVSFAYPYGIHGTYNLHTRDLLAEAGFRAACTQTPGPVTTSSDLLRLPRAGMMGTDSVMKMNMKIRGVFDFRRFVDRLHN